ncbi:hypothetical protein [Kitasatospora kifunensis]|uniref:Uncharacterized protein n=1 Tax=Kitasatospora kifunensis TaxID=58351 RepID=A0A7W7R722_KITKI|nr:hypothetical protein [Kitasatospora kifunensis]MBB4926612.1 hypothetical protein [Kitasatospora kifunensis]
MATPVLLQQAAPAPSGDDGPVPVPAALADLLPAGGLRRGSAVSVQDDAGLLLALACGAGRTAGAEQWYAAVGLPELGLLAATGYGIDPGRLLLVDAPGRQWPEVLAALAGAVEVILLRPSGTVAPQLAARLGAVLRRTGCVLLVAGAWPGAELRLSVRESHWVGLGDGYGLLAGRQARVLVEGRGAAARGRTARLWLPDEHGVVRAMTAAELAAELADEATGAGVAAGTGAVVGMGTGMGTVTVEAAPGPAAVGVGLGEQPGDAVGRGRLTAV